MATQKKPNITVTADVIRNGVPDYEPQDGTNGIKYEVAPGKTVTIRTVTPALVKRYNEHAKRRLPDGNPDPNDRRSSHDVATERMPTITEPAHENLNWEEIPMIIIWRIIEDFLSLSSPKFRPETLSSGIFPDQ